MACLITCVFDILISVLVSAFMALSFCLICVFANNNSPCPVNSFSFTKRSLIGQLFLYAWDNLFSVLQSFMAQSELKSTVEQCCFVYASYQKTLTQLRSCLRGLSYDRDIFE